MSSTLTVDAKKRLAGEIKRLVQVYAEITAEELLEQTMKPEADATWNMIVANLDELIGE